MHVFLTCQLSIYCNRTHKKHLELLNHRKHTKQQTWLVLYHCLSPHEKNCLCCFMASISKSHPDTPSTWHLLLLLLPSCKGEGNNYPTCVWLIVQLTQSESSLKVLNEMQMSNKVKETSLCVGMMFDWRAEKHRGCKQDLSEVDMLSPTDQGICVCVCVCVYYICVMMLMMA